MNTNYIMKLKPFFKKKLWGWEKWIVACHKDGNSKVENGIYKNQYLCNVLGCGYNFPILIKIINAEKPLSVQVHPNDEYAAKYENSNGKTEFWYVLKTQGNCTLISGIKKGLNAQKLKHIIDNKEIENYLKRTHVKEGDGIYIPSGTVHALESGIKVIEVQQNSNITYRLYDWKRDRKIHIAKSLDVIDYECKNNSGKIENFKQLITPYFSTKLIQVKHNYCDTTKINFQCYVIISGSGFIKNRKQIISLNAEETIYIPQGLHYEIIGNIKLLKINV